MVRLIPVLLDLRSQSVLHFIRVHAGVKAPAHVFHILLPPARAPKLFFLVKRVARRLKDHYFFCLYMVVVVVVVVVVTPVSLVPFR